MTDVPGLTLVITPVDALIVATLGLALVHVPPVTVELNVVPAPRQAVVTPLNTPASDVPTTVTVLVSIASAHPPIPTTLYVITDVPDVKPVIKPVAPSIVATLGLALVQVPPETVELNAVVNPAHTVVVPLKVPVLGPALTVTVLVAVTSEQPDPLTV